RDPHMSIALRKFRQRTAALPKSYSPTQINDATITQIQDAVGATMSVIGSGVSGNIRTLAIGLYEEFE
ncbi:MAG: NAD synthetase, partial [Pseudomonas sp.]|nr:NAD synthetase [Pseudomonas sp.]